MERIHLGKRLVSIRFEGDQEAERPTLQFEDGEEFMADLVIGADGIKSVSEQISTSSSCSLMKYRSAFAKATFQALRLSQLG